MHRNKFYYDDTLSMLVKDIVFTLRDFFPNVDVDKVKVVVCRDCRSKAVARIYMLPSVLRFALGLEPIYVIEVIEGNFFTLSESNRVKVLLHELLHIPKSFSGGLRPHGRYVNNLTVEKLYHEYIKRKGAELT